MKGQKCCTKCHVLKSVEMFRIDYRGAEGKRLSGCKACHSEYALRNKKHLQSLKRARRQQHREETNAANRAYYHANRDKIRATYNQQYQEDEFVRLKIAESSRREKYNLEPEEYQAKLEKQGHRCVICKKENDSGRPLCVDHDHACCSGGKSCGKCVRGLLCVKCNAGLGSFQDNPDFLRVAAQYIESYKNKGMAAHG
jgi:recombination endonuclease VII